MVFRICFSILLLFSILFLPFWVSAILAFVAMIYFSFFAEAVFLLLLSDVLYGTKEAKFSQMVFIPSTISFLILIILEFSKKKLKFYPK